MHVASKQLVVVVHGIAGKRLWMQPLSMRLRKSFRVVNFSYFSVAGSIDYHAQRFSRFLTNLKHDGPVNIVAHSMGSIVTRAALATERPSRLNRVVLLAPPNSGSPVARILNYGLGWACRPLSDLSSSDTSYVNQMPSRLTCETGVIAARYDVVVPVQSTRMAGLMDHVTITSTHNTMLFSSRVGQLVTRFLNHGRFVAA